MVRTLFLLVSTSRLTANALSNCERMAMPLSPRFVSPEIPNMRTSYSQAEIDVARLDPSQVHRDLESLVVVSNLVSVTGSCNRGEGIQRWDIPPKEGDGLLARGYGRRGL
jgi:hypothetical protein